MKKKLTAVALIVCMLAIMLVGASLAYFTDSDAETNTFTMGNVAIDLIEKKDGEVIEGGIEYDSSKVYPGAVLSKEVTVENTGNNPAYLRVKVAVPMGMIWDLSGVEKISGDIAELSFLDVNTEDWTLDSCDVVLGENTNIEDSVVTYTFTYNEVFVKEAVTEALFNKVTIPTGFDHDGTTVDYYITVTAEAIQADGFADADAAWTAFDAK